MKPRASAIARRRAVLFAIILALAVTWITGLIPRWGQWYSTQPFYRAQVEAFFDGRLALSHDVEAVTHDLAWIDDGVQQVWGLGVPMWITPFEAIGRVIGITPFPDRIAMLFGMILVFYVLARTWFGPGGDRSYGSIGAFAITALLPGVITMMRGRMVVYEEAAAYAYGASMLLMAGLVMMLRRPSPGRYLLLCAFAGATGLIRPTVWFYGAATAAIATYLYIVHVGSLRRALRTVVVAGGLFLLGGAALYGTNHVRFGNGGEFGHRLNLADLPGNTYATRFDYPFAHEPFGSGAKEILGGAFGRPELRAPVGYKFYVKKLHKLQSKTPRWREYYFTTFTWVYAPFVLLGFGLAIAAWLRARRKGDELEREARWLGVWAMMAFAPLFVFYTRSPSVSSRYLLDIAPSVAALLVIAWRFIAARLASRPILSRVAFGVFALYWASSAITWTAKRPWMSPIRYRAAVASTYDITQPALTTRAIPSVYEIDDPWIHAYIGGDQVLCDCFMDVDATHTCDHLFLGPNADVFTFMNFERHPLTTVIEHEPPDRCELGGPLPDACTLDDPDPELPDALPIPPTRELVTRDVDVALYRNGTNWDLTSGRVAVSTYFFVENPEFVDVELAPLDPADLTAGWTPQVRAKVQLEELEQLGMASTPRGVRVRFAGPRTPKYQTGIEMVFLAFGPPENIDQPFSDYRLWRVAYRDEP